MKQKLGEILVASGAVTQADVDASLAEQSSGSSSGAPSRLGDLLIARGKLGSAAVAKALAVQYGLPFAEVRDVPLAVAQAVPADVQKKLRLVPFKIVGRELYVALADPANVAVIDELKKTLGRPVRAHVAAADEVDAMLGAVPAPRPAPAPPVGPVVPAVPAVGARSQDDDLEGLFAGLDDDLSEAVLEGEMVVETEAGTAPPVEMTLEPSQMPSGVMDMLAISPEVPVRTKPGLAAVARPSPSKDPKPLPAPSPRGAAPRETKTIEMKLPMSAAMRPSAPSLAPVTQQKAVEVKKPPTAPGGVPAVAKPKEPTAAKAAPLPVPPPAAPAKPRDPSVSGPLTDLPDWLRADGGSDPSSGWTGALDGATEPQLAKAVAKALVKRGLLSEKDLLDALERK